MVHPIQSLCIRNLKSAGFRRDYAAYYALYCLQDSMQVMHSERLFSTLLTREFHRDSAACTIVIPPTVYRSMSVCIVYMFGLCNPPPPHRGPYRRPQYLTRWCFTPYNYLLVHG